MHLSLLRLSLIRIRLSRGDGGLAQAVGMMSIPFPFIPRANSVIVTILFPLHHFQYLQHQRRGGVGGTIKNINSECLDFFSICFDENLTITSTFLFHHFTSS